MIEVSGLSYVVGLVCFAIVLTYIIMQCIFRVRKHLDAKTEQRIDIANRVQYLETRQQRIWDDVIRLEKQVGEESDA